MLLNNLLDEIATEVLVNRKKVTLFVGSGFSTWFGYPSWIGLVTNYCNKLIIDYPKKIEFILDIRGKTEKRAIDVPEAFQILIDKLNLDEIEVKKYIRNKFKDIESLNRKSKFDNTNLDFIKYSKLYNLSKYCKIITTNYDTLIEDIFLEHFKSKTNVYYPNDRMLNRNFFNSNGQADILKMHGCVNKEDLMVISENDYKNIRTSKEFSVLRECLRNNFASNINIFLGYSVSDENIRELLLKNEDILGEDKEKSYVFNIKNINEIKNSNVSPIVGEDQYKDIGVSEIFINSHDELITVLDSIDNMYTLIKENSIDNNYKTFTELDDNVDLEKCGLVIYCYNQKLYNQSRLLAEEIIRDIDLVANKAIKDYIEINIRGILGVIYETSEDESLKEKGKSIIEEIINKYQRADFILDEIGKLYLVRGIDKNYDSTVTNTLGINITYNYDSVKKAIEYLSCIKDKNEDILYNLMEAYSIVGDLNNTNKIGKKIPKESKYYSEKELFLGNAYFYKAVELDSFKHKDTPNIINQYKNSIKFYEKYLNNINTMDKRKKDRDIILSNLVRGYIRIGEYTKAKLYCDELLKENPAEQIIHKYLINIYINEEKIDELIDECNYEIRHLKDNSKVKDSIKYIKAQGIYAKAKYIHEVKESISICEDILTRGNYFDVAVSRVNMYRSIGHMKEMRNACIEAYEIYPLNNQIYNLTNDLFSGHFSGEEKEYNIENSFRDLMWMQQYKQKFIEENPSVEERDFILEGDKKLRKEKIYFEEKLIEEEVKLNDIILLLENKIDVSMLDLLKQIVDYYNNSKYDLVLELIDKNIYIKEEHYLLMFIYANSLQYTDRIEEALNVYGDIITNFIELYDNYKKKVIYLLYGNCYFYKEEYIKAHDTYIEAYNIDSKFKNAIYNISICKKHIAVNLIGEEKKKQLRLCKYLLSEYINIDIYRHTVYLELRDICYMLGDVDDMIDSAIKSRMITIDYNEVLISHYLIIAGYLIKENDKDVEYYINSGERIIEEVGLENLDNIIASQYYLFKGIYYKRYSRSETLEAFKIAYELDKSDFNKGNLDKEIEGVNNIEINYGRFSIKR